MDQERNEVREVDDARRRVAEDVRSVAENANVVERAKETAQSKIEDVKSTVGERMQQVREGARSMGESARNINLPMSTDNPIGMLIAGVAVGFLIGVALPVSRFESERIGPIAHDMKTKAREAGTEVMRRGGEVIKETISASKEAATNSIREQTREMGLGEQSED
jgi:ElaB/YqjD/DUF883 family membrane-anchored ribosome-binding protein